MLELPLTSTLTNSSLGRRRTSSKPAPTSKPSTPSAAPLVAKEGLDALWDQAELKEVLKRSELDLAIREALEIERIIEESRQTPVQEEELQHYHIA